MTVAAALASTVVYASTTASATMANASVSSTASAVSGLSTGTATLRRLSNATRAGNWTTFSCDWLDEIYDIQNSFYWQHASSTEIILLYISVCVFGALANLFVIVAFARASHLRNLRNYFIVNLAFSDLTLCTVTAPATIYLTLNLFWPFGNVACQIMASIQAVNMFVSCLTLVLIAMDRFLLTLCPVKWRLAAKAPLICYLIVWLTSLIVAAPYFFAVAAEPVTMFDPWNLAHADQMLAICHRKRPEICLEKTWHRLPFSRRTYTLTVLAIQYILPLSALGFAYSQIGSTIRKRVKYNTTIDHERKQLLTKRNRKALLLLLLLVIIYGIAWLPINAYNVLNVLDVIEFSQYRYIFCHLIGMSSACINPILYALINDSFRSAFLNMLRPLFWPCTKYTAVDAGHSMPVNHLQHTHTTISNSMGNLNADTPPKTRRSDKVGTDTTTLLNGIVVVQPSPSDETALLLVRRTSVTVIVNSDVATMANGSSERHELSVLKGQANGATANNVVPQGTAANIKRPQYAGGDGTPTTTTTLCDSITSSSSDSGGNEREAGVLPDGGSTAVNTTTAT